MLFLSSSWLKWECNTTHLSCTWSSRDIIRDHFDCKYRNCISNQPSSFPFTSTGTLAIRYHLFINNSSTTIVTISSSSASSETSTVETSQRTFLHSQGCQLLPPTYRRERGALGAGKRTGVCYSPLCWLLLTPLSTFHTMRFK